MESTLGERFNPVLEDQISIRVHRDHAARADDLRPFVENLPGLTDNMSARGATRPAVLRVALEMGLRLMSSIESNPSLSVGQPILVTHRDHIERAGELVQLFENPPKPNRKSERGRRTLVLYTAIELGLMTLEAGAKEWVLEELPRES